MSFFSLKQNCGCCGKSCGWNRWRVKKGKSWLCPQCFKDIGGIKNIELLSTKSISELKQIISQKQFSEVNIAIQYCNDELSENISKSSTDPVVSIIPNSIFESSKNSFIENLTFKVAGVTFKTGRKSRQVMLKNMYFNNTPPFDGDIVISFERYNHEGKLAIGVYANGLQIGDVPASVVSTFDNYWVSDYNADFRIYGGRNKNWGCEIDVTFFQR